MKKNVSGPPSKGVPAKYFYTRYVLIEKQMSVEDRLGAGLKGLICALDK